MNKIKLILWNKSFPKKRFAKVFESFYFLEIHPSNEIIFIKDDKTKLCFAAIYTDSTLYNYMKSLMTKEYS